MKHIKSPTEVKMDNSEYLLRKQAQVMAEAHGKNYGRCLHCNDRWAVVRKQIVDGPVTVNLVLCGVCHGLDDRTLVERQYHNK